MAKKRQANAPDLQNQLASDAARQTQLQAQQQQQQQQQMLLNQMKGMGPSVAQGLQHLQHQMQPSPIPQQPQQQMGMANPPCCENRLSQQSFQLAQQQARQSTSVPLDMNQLNPAEKELAGGCTKAPQCRSGTPESTAEGRVTTENESSNVTGDAKFWPGSAIVFLSAAGLQQYATASSFAPPATAKPRNSAQHGPNPSPGYDASATAAARSSSSNNNKQQQRQLNQAMGSHLGQQQGLADNQVFANMESIRNDQKAGLLAQQAGQVVVPASSGPGRNPTQQSMSGLPMQNMQNNQQVPGQQPRPQQLSQQQQQQLNLQQQLAAQQARLQQGGGRPMQQPNGLQGPATTSQSPGMSTLTAPMQQPPVPMAQMNAGNQPMNQFNQGNARPAGAQQASPMNHPMVKAMLNSLSPEQRQNVSNLPPEKLRELLGKWSEQQRMLSSMAQASKPQQMAGMPGQPPGGQMGGLNQFPMAGVSQQPQPGNGNLQQAMQGQGFNPALNNAALNNQAARNMHIMDSMDIPAPVLTQLAQMPLNIPRILGNGPSSSFGCRKTPSSQICETS